jgi:hypothetical protein
MTIPYVSYRPARLIHLAATPFPILPPAPENRPRIPRPKIKKTTQNRALVRHLASFRMQF